MRLMMILFAASAALASASPSHAQTAIRPSGCTMSCGCDRIGCYCSRTGGSGGSCKADSQNCTVYTCMSSLRAGTMLAVAANGAVVTVSLAPGGAAEVTTVKALRWQAVARGHSRGVDCRGTVVAEYYDPRTAAASRARSRQLAI